MFFRLLMLLPLLALPVSVLAQSASSVEAPSLEEARKVINYLYNAKEGIFLIDIKLCQEVPLAKGSENRYGCVEELKSGNVLAGETVMVWMHYFAPVNTNQKVILVYKRGFTPKGTQTLNVAGGPRYRRWRKFTPDKAGKWEVQVIFEPETGDAVMLGRLPVTVQ